MSGFKEISDDSYFRIDTGTMERGSQGQGQNGDIALRRCT